MAGDALVVVALRTDQHDIQRRLDVILSASAPEYPKADAQVIAREEGQVTASDSDRLRAVFGYDVLAHLGWPVVVEDGKGVAVE